MGNAIFSAKLGINFLLFFYRRYPVYSNYTEQELDD